MDNYRNPALASLPDPALIVLIGAAGSGKTTLAKAAWPDPHTRILSSDELRDIISGNPADQESSREAFAALYLLLGSRLKRGLTTVVDATSTHAYDRAQLLELARLHQVPAVAVIVHPPLPVVLARNAARPGPAPGQEYGQRVPEEAVRRQHRDITNALGTLADEGFSRIILMTGHDKGQERTS